MTSIGIGGPAPSSRCPGGLALPVVWMVVRLVQRDGP
jgi:hypothetical protein